MYRRRKSLPARRRRSGRNPSARGLVVGRTRFQPLVFRALQRFGCACARLSQLRGLFRIALEQVGQGERRIDFLDDPGDLRDFGFSLRNLLLQVYVFLSTRLCGLSRLALRSLLARSRADDARVVRTERR